MPCQTIIEGPDRDGEFGWDCVNDRCDYSANGFAACDVVLAAVEHAPLATHLT